MQLVTMVENAEGTNVFANLSEFLVFTNEIPNTDATIAIAEKNDQMVGTSFINGKFFYENQGLISKNYSDMSDICVSYWSQLFICVFFSPQKMQSVMREREIAVAVPMKDVSNPVESNATIAMANTVGKPKENAADITRRNIAQNIVS